MSRAAVARSRCGLEPPATAKATDRIMLCFTITQLSNYLKTFVQQNKTRSDTLKLPSRQLQARARMWVPGSRLPFTASGWPALGVQKDWSDAKVVGGGGQMQHYFVTIK